MNRANIHKSVIRFFTEAFDPDPVIFDVSSTVPALYDGNTVSKWAAVHFGVMPDEAFKPMDLYVFLCTRKDDEGHEQAAFADALSAAFLDESAVDNNKRIPVYRFDESGPVEQTGVLLPLSITFMKPGIAPDDTKFLPVHIILMKCF